MPLRFANGVPFATGACRYIDRPASERETTPRIILPVRVEDVETQAVLDTGGVYLLCNPGFADILSLDPRNGFQCEPLFHRGRTTKGALYRLKLTLLAEEGESLDMEATAFVPTEPCFGAEDLPNYLGLHCCLERVRFAVDPAADRFYFGSV